MNGQSLQAFTAIGRVRTGSIYRASACASVTHTCVEQADVDPFRVDPFRIDVEYFSARETPITPLIDSLTFIRSKKHWGAPFRFGLIRVPQADFALIAVAMDCTFPHVLPPTG